MAEQLKYLVCRYGPEAGWRFLCFDSAAAAMKDVRACRAVRRTESVAILAMLLETDACGGGDGTVIAAPFTSKAKAILSAPQYRGRRWMLNGVPIRLIAGDMPDEFQQQVQDAFDALTGKRLLARADYYIDAEQEIENAKPTLPRVEAGPFRAMAQVSEKLIELERQGYNLFAVSTVGDEPNPATPTLGDSEAGQV